MPEVMRVVSEGEMERVWSISSSRGFTMDGKAESQGSSMPTRWTPWPGKKRAVFGRVGVVYARVDVCVDVSVISFLPFVVCKDNPLACRRRPLFRTLIMV